MSFSVATLNKLRKDIRSSLEAVDRPKPIIHISEYPMEMVEQTLKTISSELGMRFLTMDLAEGIDTQLLSKTGRHGRIISLHNIDKMDENLKPGLHKALCADNNQTLPIIIDSRYVEPEEKAEEQED